MQALDANVTPLFTSVSMTDSGTTTASVDLPPAGTPIRVHSSMTLSSVTAEFAVFDFSIGMHGNGYPGRASLGGLGENKGVLHYNAAAPITATVIYDYDYDIANAGTDIYGNLVTFGMSSIYMSRPLGSYPLPGTSPMQIAGHYHSEETVSLSAGDNAFTVSFGPNVTGPIDWIDGQFDGTVTFIFAPEPVPGLSAYVRLALVACMAMMVTAVQHTRRRAAAGATESVPGPLRRASVLLELKRPRPGCGSSTTHGWASWTNVASSQGSPGLHAYS